MKEKKKKIMWISGKCGYGKTAFANSIIKEFGLAKIIEFVKEKYPEFNIYVGLQGLTFFRDAEQGIEKKRFRLTQNVSWKKLKKYILEEVDNYRDKYLKT